MPTSPFKKCGKEAVAKDLGEISSDEAMEPVGRKGVLKKAGVEQGPSKFARVQAKVGGRAGPYEKTAEGGEWNRYRNSFLASIRRITESLCR